MAQRIEAGWDFDTIGDFSLAVTDSGGSSTNSITTGTYAHTSLSSVMNGDYIVLATVLQNLLNADLTLTGTYTVNWDGPNFRYVIACDESFTLDAGTNAVARNILGMPTAGATPSATSYTSDRRPYYAIETRQPGPNRPTDDYEAPGVAEGAWSMGGQTFTISALSAINFHDFNLLFEPRARTHVRDAVASEPWTWDLFWQHVRGHEPFVLINELESTVFRMRPEAVSFNARPSTENYRENWHLSFKCYVLGRL